MAGTVSLFQKYRSQSFADLVGQEVVVKTLSNAIKNGNPAQVYLFCGPRGTGKTSTARILAKALNCDRGPTVTPCNECQSCRSISDGSNVDLVEIDAASNTQVDKIRDVIVDRVMYAPAHSRFKIFIIDEVHMLSQSSFNALLKTLEEPPAHVIFILATTDPHKLPATVLSRCQRHDFQRLTLAQIAARVKYVSASEGMECSDEAAEMIARAADGSMRDALSELGAVAALADGHINAAMVEMALGLSGNESIRRFTDSLLDGDAPAALGQLNSIIDSGRDLRRLASELCEHLRRLLLIMAGAADADTFDISEDAFQALQAQAKRFTMGKVMGWLSSVINLQSSLTQTNNARVLWEMLTIRLAIPSAEDSLHGLARRVERLEELLSGKEPLPIRELSPNKERSVLPETAEQPAAAPPKAVGTENKAVSSLRSAPSVRSASSVRAEGTARPAAASVPEAKPRSARDYLEQEAKKSAEENRSANLGWGDVSPQRLAAASRPAPKKSPSAGTSAASRAIAANSNVSRDPKSVRDSWQVASLPKTASAAKKPSVPAATAAELKDLKSLWLGFLSNSRDEDIQNYRLNLAEAQRFAYAGGCLDVFLPARHEGVIEALLPRTAELNDLISTYRSNITKLRFFAEENRPFADAGSQQEHEAVVNQIITMFGAEIIDG
ncbi:MAG: DNA polymerase III subunit gamma/tau [bacterium]|nr:DNA polymerase III subunit gamma/tau [bacterium]